MNHMGTLTLETERLILRPFVLQDAPAIFENWANDKDVTKFLTWNVHGNVETTRATLRDWIRQYPNRLYYQWCIQLKQGSIPIGSICANAVNEISDSVEIGYCIGKNWWNKGYTSEAFSCIIEYLFERVGIKYIIAKHDVKNPNSGKVMQKCGMKFMEIQTIERQNCKKQNQESIHQMAVYQLENSMYK